MKTINSYRFSSGSSYDGTITPTWGTSASKRGGHFANDGSTIYLGVEDSSRDGRCYIFDGTSDPLTYDRYHEWQPTEARGVLSASLDTDVVAHFYFRNGIASYLAIVDYSGGTYSITSTSNLGAVMSVTSNRSQMIKIADGVLVACVEYNSNIRLIVITYTDDYSSATLQSDTIIHSSKQKASLSNVGVNASGNYVVVTASGGGVTTQEINSSTYSVTLIDNDPNGNDAFEMVKKIKEGVFIAVGKTYFRIYSIDNEGVITSQTNFTNTITALSHSVDCEVFNEGYVYVHYVDNSSKNVYHGLLELNSAYGINELGYSVLSAVTAVAGNCSSRISDDRIIISFQANTTSSYVYQIKLT